MSSSSFAASLARMLFCTSASSVTGDAVNFRNTTYEMRLLNSITISGANHIQIRMNLCFEWFAKEHEVVWKKKYTYRFSRCSRIRLKKCMNFRMLTRNCSIWSCRCVGIGFREIRMISWIRCLPLIKWLGMRLAIVQLAMWCQLRISNSSQHDRGWFSSWPTAQTVCRIKTIDMVPIKLPVDKWHLQKKERNWTDNERQRKQWC